MCLPGKRCRDEDCAAQWRLQKLDGTRNCGMEKTVKGTGVKAAIAGKNGIGKRVRRIGHGVER